MRCILLDHDQQLVRVKLLPSEAQNKLADRPSLQPRRPHCDCGVLRQPPLDLKWLYEYTEAMALLVASGHDPELSHVGHNVATSHH